MTKYWSSALALLMVVGLFLAFGAPNAEAEATKPLGKMPQFTLKDANGKTVSSKDLAGKVVIIDFWATWCPPCRKEIPGFIELQKQYGKQGLTVVGFSFDDDAKAHTDYIKEQKMNYSSVLATDATAGKTVAAFEKIIGKIEGIPTTVVVDKKGNIVWMHTGYADKADFEKVVKPLLK